jgi:RNA polymerase sigma factor (sigma-70 family)
LRLTKWHFTERESELRNQIASAERRINQHFNVNNSVSEGSISRWIRELKSGSPEAAQQLWDRYSVRLLELARHKLANSTRVADEEDVAITVFESICRAAVEGRFTNLQNRDELWWMLVMVTKQKAVDQIRHERRKKRGGGTVVNETDFGSDSDPFRLDQILSIDPTPDFLVIMDEEHRRLLGLLRDDQLRAIAVLRIQGCTYDEIAAQLDISARTVIRKLNLIRTCWQREL